MRSKDIVVQQLGKETLVYDTAINKAYCLNETSTIIYNACNGTTTFDELKNRHNLTEDLIYFALDELKNQNLLQDENYSAAFAGMNRREVIRKVGMSSMLALPVITTLLAPKSVAAASCQANGQTCTFDNFTQSNCCSGLRCLGNCIACYASGDFYANGNDLASCNASPEKNLCCNTSGNATNNGTNCFCP